MIYRGIEVYELNGGWYWTKDRVEERVYGPYKSEQLAYDSIDAFKLGEAK